MKRTPNAPKHRAEPTQPALVKGLRKSVVLSGVAVAATGIAVSSGVALSDVGVADATIASADLGHAAESAAAGEGDAGLGDRGDGRAPSRSDRRADPRAGVDTAKAQALSQESGGQLTRTKDVASGNPRDIARALLPGYGWSQDQFGCLDSLWTKESGWSTTADNPTSSAYGIPQALPGSKMSSAGPDWEHNPETQIRWGLGYIQARYGNPCGAWGHSQSYNWY